jgi:phage terminase large subunit-like protein
VVGAPMLLDNNGDAVFIYTPPSLRTVGLSKARDPRHAAKMFKMAQKDETGRWAAFSFTSHDNPHLSREALGDITLDMTALAYRQEIMAEDIDTNPHALWRREWIEANRLVKAPNLARVAVAVDPSATRTGDECGIVGGGMAKQGRAGDRHLYVLRDESLQGSPDEWGRAAVTLYHQMQADVMVAEKNNGGEMVSYVIRTIDPSVRIKLVHASRGKQTRAEPVSAVYEQGRAHHVGAFPLLEDQLCQWEPGDASPDRLDALVWLGTELIPPGTKKAGSWRPA